MKASDCVPGAKVGRLEVIETFRLPDYKFFALCRCDCGAVKSVLVAVIGRAVNSCGCLRREVSRRIAMTHLKDGHIKQRGIKHMYPSAYNVSSAARQRCTNPNDKDYHNYGGRGIEFRFESVAEMCRYIVECIPHGKERWDNQDFSIDRIDVNGHYERGNLRWATWSEQVANRRVVTCDG